MDIANGESGASVRAKLNYLTTTDLLGRDMVNPAIIEPRVNILPFKQALEDIRDGLRPSLRILSIGDSLATRTHQKFSGSLMDILEAHFPSETVRTTNKNADAMMGEIIPSASTAVRVDKTDYTKSFIGIKTTHTVGQVSYWSVGGFAVGCDRILIPIFTDPGAGSVRIEVSERPNALDPTTGTWRDPLAGEVTVGPALTGGQLIVSADAAVGCYTVALDFESLAGRILRVTSTSGTVEMMDPMFEIRDSAAINSYWLAAGSNGFFTSNAAAIPRMADFIEAYSPDLIVICSDDSLASYQNFLPHLNDALDQSNLVPLPYVVLATTAGIQVGGGTSEPDLVARANFCAEYAAPRGWDHLDGLAMGLGDANLDTFQRGGDGVHLTGFIWNEITKQWATKHGIFNYRENLPGGNVASRSDIMRARGNRQVNSVDVVSALIGHIVSDSGWMTWGFTATGTADGVKQGTAIRLQTNLTAASTVRAYIDDPADATGLTRLGRLNSALYGGWTTAVRLDHLSANGTIWITSSEAAYNAAYGALAGNGFGFRIVNGLLHGVAWRAGALQQTTESRAMDSGSQSFFHKLTVITRPLYDVNGNVIAPTSFAEFFYDGVSLGTIEFTFSATCRSPAFNLTNGADAARNTLFFTPPQILMVPT